MVSVLNFGSSTRKLCWFVGLLFSCSTACVEQDFRLSREQLNIVDSLFLKERSIWVAQLEDSCQVLREARFEYWVDPMKTDRLRNIQKMLQR
jgi:hypothetical protein